MDRRPGRSTLALVLPLTLFVLFGMSRVTAPVSAIGALFDEELGFAAVAVAVATVGALLLFVRPVELAVARVIAGRSRPPSGAEAERLGDLLAQVSRRAGVKSGRLIVRVIDDPGANAAAGASHLLFVTTGALELPDSGLEALLAHELGHHRGLHPVMIAVVWWLSLPGLALAGIYRLLRRAVAALGQRMGTLGRALAVPVIVLLLVWQFLVMWIFGSAICSRRALPGFPSTRQIARQHAGATPLHSPPHTSASRGRKSRVRGVSRDSAQPTHPLETGSRGCASSDCG